MGDISDLMLDGTLCASCGAYLGSDNDFPTYCVDCDKGGDAPPLIIQPFPATQRKWRKVACRICGKMVKEGHGIKDHLAVVHGKVIS